MSEQYTALRTAMAEAYLGDSKAFHSMFANPATFDARIQAILTGFAQQIDTATADDLAMAANIRAFLKKIDNLVQANRISWVDFVNNIPTLLANEVARAEAAEPITNMNGASQINLYDITTGHFINGGVGNSHASHARAQVTQLGAFSGPAAFLLSLYADFTAWVGNLPADSLAWAWNTGFEGPVALALYAKVAAVGTYTLYPNKLGTWYTGSPASLAITAATSLDGTGGFWLLFTPTPFVNPGASTPAASCRWILSDQLFFS